MVCNTRFIHQSKGSNVSEQWQGITVKHGRVESSNHWQACLRRACSSSSDGQHSLFHTPSHPIDPDGLL